MTGKSKLAFWTITLIILFGLLSIVGYMMINEYQEEIVYQNLTPNGYEDIKINENTTLLTYEKNKKYGIMDYNGNIIEDALYEFNDILYGYDNYYRVFTSDNKILIKRNGKLIKDITNNTDKYILLKDETDKDSEYIIYITGDNSFATTKIKDDTYVANIFDNNKYTSKILDVNEGIVNELEGFIGKVNNSSSALEKYLIQIIEDKVNLLSIYDYSVLLKGYSKIGDEENIVGYEYCGSINNDNYITVCKDNKCGIVNSSDEVLLPLDYEEVKMVEQVEPLYFAASKNGKYGIVNFNNEEVVEFIYDNVASYNNTFILEKDNQLLITDNKLNKQLQIQLKSNDNVEYSIYNDEYIKISIHDMSNAGTPSKIIIIDQDNNIKEYKYEEFIDINNNEGKMSKDYYATYNIKNNEVYIDVYDGLSIKKSFTIIQINEISNMYLDAISSNELLLKMKTNNGDYYTILNIDTGNIVINDALKKINVRNMDNNDFIVDIEDSNLIYYKNDLNSKILEENIISSIKVTNEVYIIKKLNNTVYLYKIGKR